VAAAIVVAVALVLPCVGAGPAAAKPPRWTEAQAENALLSRAHIAYADCLALGKRGRRFMCLIEYTDGGEWFMVIVPGRDGYSVRRYEPV
jgi:hypothetical protein